MKSSPNKLPPIPSASARRARWGALLRKKDVRQLLEASSASTGVNALKKTLGPLDLTLLGIGAIVGTGIFVLTGTGAVTAGPSLMLSFVLAAVACCLAALTYAEFASTIPVAGSAYTYAYATLGELPAWIIGWDLMLEYGLATSAVSVGWSGYLQALLRGFGIELPVWLSAAPGVLPGTFTLLDLPALLVMLAISALLARGVRESARLNNLMVSVKLGVIALVLAVGVWHVKPANWHPFMPHGLSGMFGAAAVMFFAFIGFDSVSSAAEEVRDPKRDLPIGIIASLSICALLYVAVAAVMTGIAPSEAFERAAHPVSQALQWVGADWAAGFVDLGAVCGMLTVILVMSYGQSRIVLAMARDGLLPPRFARIHPRFATPAFSTWAVGLFFGAVAALVPLDMLAELVNMGTLGAFTMVSIAILVLRRTHPNLRRGFRCPRVPALPLLAIAACAFLMTQLQAITWMAFGVWLSIGLLIYFGYARTRSKLAS